MKHNCIFWLLFIFPAFIMAESDIALSDTITANRPLKVEFNGQLAGWSAYRFTSPPAWMNGGRFVPTLTGRYSTDTERGWDTELSLNLNGSWWSINDSVGKPEGQLKPYRIWVRYYTPHFELRAGLQKINFGAAKLLRPLMWFDGMDIRDPLQLTDGVYGVMSRYFFDHNITLWGWMLIGNQQTRGYDWIATQHGKPEAGGRMEVPVGPGEIGLSYHHRKVDLSVDENRVGFDGKWDLGIGLWVEGSFTALEKNPYITSPLRTDLLNLGMDYTFPLGNGLGVTAEYFRYHAGDRFVSGGIAANVLASMISYPVSLIDNVSVMVFCLPANGKTNWMNYLSWSRTYDNLSVYLIGFLTPEGYSLPQPATGSRNLFAGKGVQLMMSYNF